jgi:transcriptional regulator with XRE-family HTH domain
MTELHGQVPLTNLRNWRKAQGLSIRELARRSGVGKTTIVRLEYGRSDAYVASARRLAAGLNITVEQLAYDDPHDA